MSYDTRAFDPYIDESKSTYDYDKGVKIVLKKNAPESAVKALEKFKKDQEKARKNGEKF